MKTKLLGALLTLGLATLPLASFAGGVGGGGNGGSASSKAGTSGLSNSGSGGGGGTATQGGGNGGEAGLIHNPGRPDERNLKSKMVGVVLRRGDVLRTVGAGGGGWGHPEERDPTLIERDQQEGYA